MPALTNRLITTGLLALAFVFFTLLVSGGALSGLDHDVAQATHSIYSENLHRLFQGIAEIGGLELTTILLAALVIYLWQRGFGRDAFVGLVFVGAIALEVLYKFFFYHPGPPRSLSHKDGPSITDLLPGSSTGNSFPSGHMVRAVVVYGLLAFVIWRLTPFRWVRALVTPLAVALIVVLAFDRLYLDVHWESDVIGGLLLGTIALLAGTVWLDRPRKA